MYQVLYVVNLCFTFCCSLVTNAMQELEDAGCVRVNDDDSIEPLMAGTIASQYYLNYTTVAMFTTNIGADTSIEARIPETLQFMYEDYVAGC